MGQSDPAAAFAAMESTYRRAQRSAYRADPWPSYLERRHAEFLSYVEFLPKRNFDRALEIGCGTGYYTALLSHLCRHVTGTDLEDENIESHTLGLGVARNFLQDLHVGNVALECAAAENLPYADETFDLVFSSHVLEHVPDLEKAMAEIFRVLRPGGINFCVVPTTMSSVYAWPLHYVYLLRRAIHHVIQVIRAIGRRRRGAPLVSPSTLKSMHSYRRHLPFPPPHGVASHYLEELLGSSFRRWTDVLGACGGWRIVSVASSQISPILPLLSPFAPHLAVRCHRATRAWELAIGRRRLLKNLGFTGIFVLEKMGQATK